MHKMWVWCKYIDMLDYFRVIVGFILKGEGGTKRFLLTSPWGNSVKYKQEVFEPQRLTLVVNPSVSDRGHRS